MPDYAISKIIQNDQESSWTSLSRKDPEMKQTFTDIHASARSWVVSKERTAPPRWRSLGILAKTQGLHKMEGLKITTISVVG